MADVVVLEPIAPKISEDPNVLQWEETHLKEGTRIKNSLGYSGLEKKALKMAGKNIIARVLNELGIKAFDDQAVWEYKCQKKELPEPAENLKRQWRWYCRSAENLFFALFLVMLLGAFSTGIGLNVAKETMAYSLITSLAISVTIGSALGACKSRVGKKYGFKELAEKRKQIYWSEWRKFDLYDYSQRHGEIPLFALHQAERIKAVLPGVEFLVEELALPDSVDPLLIVRFDDVPGSEIYIAVWNEPGFFQPSAV